MTGRRSAVPRSVCRTRCNSRLALLGGDGVPRSAGENRARAGRWIEVVFAALVATTPVRAWAACPALPGNAFAFLPLNPPTDNCRPDPIVRWFDPHVVFDCSFFADGQHGAACGENAAGCVDLCNRAANTWNADMVGRFQFVPADASTPVAFCTSGNGPSDGRTSIGGSATVCDGTAFGAHVIAVTLRETITQGPNAGELVDSDITVNNAFQFDPVLFRATVGHELGHVLGLDHPDQCGHDAIVLMRSAFQLPSNDPCFVSEPTADDLRGAQMIYAQIGPTPTPTAEPVCGDADGNGEVTVSDGVQVLRAAADLSSTCTLAVCDVDGNGAITVSDAVAVLRRAAGLEGANACRF